MAKKINRREFLVRGVGSLAGLTIAGAFTRTALGAILNENVTGGTIDSVPLGESGLVVSRMALGTGSIGGGGASNQTRLGQETFTRMLRHGYERGVRFVDMAEAYGSMPFVGRAIEGLPRENITLLTKMTTRPDGSARTEAVRPKVEEFLRLLGTDYIDILLMHFMTSGDWSTTRTHYMEGLARAKEEGLVRAVGISCHSLEAIRVAATHPWVDVIMARINPFGTNMDASPAEVGEALHFARENGKGLVGMKIFGEGKHVTDSEREQSIRHAIYEARVHAMTLGLESVAQMDAAVDCVARVSPGYNA